MGFGSPYAKKEGTPDKKVERDESIINKAIDRGWMKYPARRGWMTNPAPWKILDAGIERTFWPASVVPPVAPSWMPVGVSIKSKIVRALTKEEVKKMDEDNHKVPGNYVNIFTYKRTADRTLAKYNPWPNDKGNIVRWTPYWDDNKYKSEAEKIGIALGVKTSTQNFGFKKYTFDNLVAKTAKERDVFNYVIARIAKKIGPKGSPKIEAKWQGSNGRLIKTSRVAYEEALKIWNVMSTGDFLKNMRKVDVTATSDPLLPRVMAAAGDLQKVEDKLTNADAASETHANASVGAAPPPAAAIPDIENNLNNKSDDSAAADAAEQQKADNNASVVQAPPAGGKRRRKYKSKKRRSKKHRSKKTKRRSPKRTRRSNVKKT